MLRYACFSVLCASLAWGAGPAAPTNVSPPDGSSGQPAQTMLCADLDSQSKDLSVTFWGRELTAPPEDDFTIIVLPDTQYYSQTFPDVFYSQIDWIVQNREALNIAFVSHVGDVVQIGANLFEWDNADRAMSRLENPLTTGLTDGIPYGISVGNHDQVPTGQAGSMLVPGVTTAIFNLHFPVSRFEGRPYWGGNFGAINDNSYQFFDAGGMEFIVVHLEYDPVDHELRQAVLQWTDDLLVAQSDKRAILTTHSLLCTGPDSPNGTHCESNVLEAPFSHQGAATYEQLKDNTNLSLMFCGHAGASSTQPRRADTFGGHTIHTMLSNYQQQEPCPSRCGNGWLRIVTFSPANDEMHVETYSPWLGKSWDGVNPHHHGFTVPYDMNGGRHFREIDTVEGTPIGMSTCVTWPGLDPGAEYEWYVTASTSADSADGPRWSFQSDGTCALPEECDDGNPCTDDSCNVTQCSHTPILGCCSDDSDCDDGNPCTDDSCDAGSCKTMPNVDACSDGDPCTIGDTCSGGACVGGTPLGCGDGNDCTDDACAEGICETTYNPAGICCAGDGDCNDDNVCSADTCLPDGTCTNAVDSNCCNEDVDCDDSDVCTLEVCRSHNAFAMRLDEPFEHVTMQTDGAYYEHPMEFPGLAASEFTVECWFKWDGTGETARTDGHHGGDTGGLTAIPLLAKGIRDQDTSPTSPGWANRKAVNYFLGIAPPSNVLAADLEEHDNGPNPGINHPVFGLNPIQPGQWYHAAMTYDGSCWQLYLNGVPETDGTNCPGVPAANESEAFFSVGVGQGWQGRTEGYFQGLIDEARVWSRARSASEIQSDMHRQVLTDRDLLGRWGFNEGAGVQVEDSSGRNNLGFVINASFDDSDLVHLGDPECSSTLPEDVAGLRVRQEDLTILRWVPGVGFDYDVASGLLSDLRSEGGVDSASCLGDDNTENLQHDDREPPVGDGFYYVVREDGTCDDGTYGASSDGAPRTVTGADCL
ncbi:MAG: hypothetical protein GY716_19705 [bacterium]|nr:hypothetical protein [bacterium]